MDEAGHREVDVSVNLSARQIEKEGFVDRFVADIREAGLAPQRVKVEITENTLMQDMDVVLPKLKQLRALGVRVAIDDFGTGYSSLSYLQQFPIDTLKIDRSFVSDIHERSDGNVSAGGASIVDAIVAMARGLNLGLIAEGVENKAQLRYLHEQGCSEVQGYIFSAALPAAEMRELLASDPFAEIVLSEPSSASA